jgi:hypothetical protein
MNTYGGVDVQMQVFLPSALVGSEWSASRPGRFTPGERPIGTNWIEGWVGHRVGLDNVEKRKFLYYSDIRGMHLGKQRETSVRTVGVAAEN